MLIGATLIEFDLVLTDEHWELKPNGVTGAELTGPPEWRIVGNDKGVWITLDAAIRHVTDKRDNWRDPLIKKNADRTLAELKKSR